MELPGELKEFVESFLLNKVDFVVVGAYAMAYHRLPRLTGDIDLFVGSNSENAERISKALVDFGFESLGLGPGDFQKPDTIIQLGYPPNRIDILTEISGVTFEEAMSTASMGQLDSLTVPFLSRELLERNKLAAGRPKDLFDLKMLRQLEE